jgi:hypothetical protein
MRAEPWSDGRDTVVGVRGFEIYGRGRLGINVVVLSPLFGDFIAFDIGAEEIILSVGCRAPRIKRIHRDVFHWRIVRKEIPSLKEMILELVFGIKSREMIFRPD